MSTNRLRASGAAKLAALAALAALSLAACGSDPSRRAPLSRRRGAGSSARAPRAWPAPPASSSPKGSSAQANAITEVIAAYNAECGDTATIEYNPTGSGAGIKSFYNGLVDFAGSDSALKTEEKDGVVETEKAKERCQGNPAWNLPMVVGPIAFAYNLDGVDKLVLNAEVLAEIFNGTITTWNDPKIAKLNSGVTLPGDKITVFFRSDESGTTENATKFLSRRRQRRLEGRAGQGLDRHRRGQEQVLRRGRGRHAAPRTPSPTWSGATPRTTTSRSRSSTAAAAPVELTGEAVGTAVGRGHGQGQRQRPGPEAEVRRHGAGAYPALLVTYEIVCSKGLDADKTAIVKDFLGYFASGDRAGSLEELGYAPLPADLLTKVKAAVTAIS